MARGTSLGQLLDDLRAEVGHSLNPALGINTRDVLINVLQRQQKRLWEDYAWPFLKVDRDIPAQAGLRYYNIPADMTFERIEKVEFKWGDRWQPLSYGIGADQYNQYDSDRDIRSWPLQRWDATDDGRIEVWPIPVQDGSAATTDGLIRISGIRKPRALVADADIADLDDQLIVLYSAAEVLARQKQADAQNKLQQAQAHYARLKARTAKGNTFVMGGGSDGGSSYRPSDPPVVAVTKVIP